MVTGPYGVNGFPLRRVNDRYVVATSTKIPVDGIELGQYNDAFFTKPKKPKQKPKQDENVFMSQVELNREICCVCVLTIN